VWHVPENIELQGSKESFTIAVTFDTKELYGKVSTSRQFIVSRVTEARN
jgi:hypothetical protein